MLNIVIAMRTMYDTDMSERQIKNVAERRRIHGFRFRAKDIKIQKDSVCAKFAHTADDGKTYQVEYNNLDMIICRMP